MHLEPQEHYKNIEYPGPKLEVLIGMCWEAYILDRLKRDVSEAQHHEDRRLLKAAEGYGQLLVHAQWHCPRNTPRRRYSLALGARLRIQ
jgi:hypothetical protein